MYTFSGLYYFERIRMVMPPVAESGVQTALLSIVIIYLGLVLVVGGRLAYLLSDGDGSNPKLLKAWGTVTVLVHQVIYLPILSILFSALHCGIAEIRGMFLQHYNTICYIQAITCLFTLYFTLQVPPVIPIMIYQDCVIHMQNVSQISENYVVLSKAWHLLSLLLFALELQFLCFVSSHSRKDLLLSFFLPFT